MDAINWHTFFFLLFGLLAAVFSVAVVATSNIVRMAFFLIVALGATSGLFFLAGASFVGAMQLLIYVGGTLVLLIFGVMLTAQGPFVSMKTRGGEWVIAAVVGGALLAVLLQAAFRIPDWHGDPKYGLPTAITGSPARPHGQLVIRATKDPAGFVGLPVRFVEAGDGNTSATSGVGVEYIPRKSLTVTLPKDESARKAKSVRQALESTAGLGLTVGFPTGSTGEGRVAPGDDARMAIRAPRGDTPPGQIGLAFLGFGESGYLLPFEIISVHLLVVLIGAAYLARTKKRRQ